MPNPHQEWPKHFNPAVDTKRAVLNAKRATLNTKRAALNTARAALDDQSGPGAKRESQLNRRISLSSVQGGEMILM